MKEQLLVALRALWCINNRQHPDPADIASLRTWVDPSDRAADDDELARLVIDAAIYHGKQAGIPLATRAAAA